MAVHCHRAFRLAMRQLAVAFERAKPRCTAVALERRPMILRFNSAAVFALLCISQAPAQSYDQRVLARVKPVQYISCAADKEIARVSVLFVGTIANKSQQPIIISRTPPDSTPLFLVSGARPNVDYFRTEPLPTVEPTERPPSEKFAILHPKQEMQVRFAGWLLVSRVHPSIAGTVPQGRRVVGGELDFWPFDTSNLNSLRRKWRNFGALVDGSIELQPTTVTLSLPDDLSGCLPEEHTRRKN
jgi:hypothetical protein